MRERFFVEQGYVSMSVECFLENFHHNHVMVDGLADFLIKRAEFELIDCNLFMSCFDWNSNFE